MRNIFLLVSFISILPLYAQRSDFNEIDFHSADSIAKLYKDEALFNVPLLTHNLTTTLETDVERFRAIYYWVSHNVRGNYSLRYKNDSKRIKLKNDSKGLQQWNREFKKEVFKRLVEKRETLCSGYAFLIKEMALLAGIECEIIDGNSPTNQLKADMLEAPNHSWNAVKLNGKWYLCDATWSSGFIDMTNYTFYFKFEESYFLMHPEEFIKAHTPINEKWTLLEADAIGSREQ